MMAFTDTPAPSSHPRWRRGRLGYWALAVLALLLPAVAMQYTDSVVWTAWDFVFAGSVLTMVGLAFEAVALRTASRAYRRGAALALGTALALVWINGAVGVIGSESEPVNLLYAGVLAFGLAGVAAARLRARGMAWALTATAGAQTLVAVGALIGGWGYPLREALEVVALNGGFAALWLAAAVCFRRAAREAELRAHPLDDEREAARP